MGKSYSWRRGVVVISEREEAKGWKYVEAVVPTVGMMNDVAGWQRSGIPHYLAT